MGQPPESPAPGHPPVKLARCGVQVLRLDPVRPDPAALARAAEVLRAGGLVIFPTETLYGLAADAANPAALERLAGLKGRDAAKPFPLIAPDQAAVAALAAEIPPAAQRLMARHWPGALTLVLPARPGLSPRLVSADGGVAVRLSPHPVAAGLARALGRALTATSANPGGEPAVADPRELAPSILAGVELLLAAGACPGGPPSTVADARQVPVRVLRSGAIVLLE
ncbi:MAG: threonylcarbamoyl-AMP synthase [Deltaproteobacteria bacterium]|nr:threonylcarbamoyl-AMP synthase [Deltaproteobacteria bacterium]